jgi:hypothetical protein
MAKGDHFGDRATKLAILDNLRAREPLASPGVARYALAELHADGMSRARVSWPTDASGRGYEFSSRKDADTWHDLAKAWGLVPGSGQGMVRIVRVEL